MPKKGLLRQKREALEMWGALSTRPDPDSARLMAEGNPEQIRIFFETIQVFVDDILRRTLAICLSRLSSSPEWTELAKEPTRFDARLHRYLKGIERCMKLRHRIPDHRPTTKETRDQKLLDLQTAHPNLTLGQIAVKYNSTRPPQEIDAKVAQSAITRLKKRQEKQRAEAVKRAEAAAKTYLSTHSLTDEQVIEKLPTPEEVLDLLTRDS